MIDKIQRVAFAVDDDAEREAFASMAKAEPFAMDVVFPTSADEAEGLCAQGRVDAVVTDLSFASGSFAERLSLWPTPYVLIAEAGTDFARLEQLTRDEASLFVFRGAPGSSGFAWMKALPVAIRKIVNIRESVNRQNAFLLSAEHLYANLLKAVPDVVYALDSSGRFIFLNESIRSFGWEPDDLVGKHFSEIIHPDDSRRASRVEALKRFRGSTTGPNGAPKLFDERRSGERMTRNLEIRIRRRSSEENYVSVSVNSYGEINSTGFRLPEFERDNIGSVGVIRDISARKRYEESLEADLRRKEAILKESHHRVKNNLQVIMSLLNLQQSALVAPRDEILFERCKGQVYSLALVYDLMYRSREYDRVDFGAFLASLAEHQAVQHEAARAGLRWTVSPANEVLGLDAAIPASLAANELISEALAGGSGEIGISLERSELGGARIITLRIRKRVDPGTSAEAVGGPEDASKERIEGAEPSGPLELAQVLASQLRGEVSVVRSDEGTTWSLSFPFKG